MNRTLRALGTPEALLTPALIGVAVAVRLLGLGLETFDYRWYLRPWSGFIAAHGGFPALAYDFADYNVPYLYLLTGYTWLAGHTGVGLLTWIKLGSIVFDVLLAVSAARIVALRGPGRRLPLLAGAAVLLLPTLVLNGAYWGQCDSIYAAFAVAGLHQLLRNRPWLGAALIGVAFAVKLQAVFLVPVLPALVLAGRMRWWHLLPVPAAYVLLAVPAWLAGRPFGDLMTIYVKQTGTYSGLTLNAPTLYAFVRPGEDHLGLVRIAGVLVAVLAFVGLLVLVAARVDLGPGKVVVLAATSTTLAPFLLPGMHERYFMLAEVLTVVAAFWVPRRLWFVPVLLQAASVVTYGTYLMQVRPAPVDLRLLTLLVLAALAAAMGTLMTRPARTLAPSLVGNTIAG